MYTYLIAYHYKLQNGTQMFDSKNIELSSPITPDDVNIERMILTAELATRLEVRLDWVEVTVLHFSEYPRTDDRKV